MQLTRRSLLKGAAGAAGVVGLGGMGIGLMDRSSAEPVPEEAKNGYVDMTVKGRLSPEGETMVIRGESGWYQVHDDQNEMWIEQLQAGEV